MSEDRDWKEDRGLWLNEKNEGWYERFEKSKILSQISGVELYHKMKDAKAVNDLRRPEHSGKRKLRRNYTSRLSMSFPQCVLEVLTCFGQPR